MKERQLLKVGYGVYTKAREDGTPFLEIHHIEWLSQGGEDYVENAIVLCPVCHRQVHYGVLDLTSVNTSVQCYLKRCCHRPMASASGFIKRS